MKVLVVSHLYPSPGVERHLFVHQQVLALKELGVESHVLSPTPWAPRILWWSERQRRRGQKPREAVRDGVVVDYPRVLQPPSHLLFDRLGDIAYHSVRRLPSVRAADYDLIHAHQALPDGALAHRLGVALGVPFVITVHGADVYQHLRMGGAVERRARETLGGADAVMANSRVVARLLRDVVAPEKLSVVLNGTTGLGTRVEPASDYLPGEPLVLTVGRLIERKATVYLIAAIGALHRAGRRVQLAVVGDGPLRRSLEERAAAEGVADAVHFVGRLEHARVLAMMARAQLFALPSWDEAFGLVYTEAMAQGTPVLALQGGGPEDFVDHGVSGGWLVPPRDAHAIADVIAWVLDNPDAAKEIGEAGRITALGLTWQRNAGLTLRAYERALEGGSSAASSSR